MRTSRHALSRLHVYTACTWATRLLPLPHRRGRHNTTSELVCMNVGHEQSVRLITRSRRSHARHESVPRAWPPGTSWPRESAQRAADRMQR
eukprot:5538033-Prymnesium_polylepis.3